MKLYLAEDFDFNSISDDSQSNVKSYISHINKTDWRNLNKIPIKDVLLQMLQENIFRPFSEQELTDPYICELPETKVIQSEIMDPRSKTYQNIQAKLRDNGWKSWFHNRAGIEINDKSSELYTSLGEMAETIKGWVETSTKIGQHSYYSGAIFVSPDNGMYYIYLLEPQTYWLVTFGYTGNVLYQNQISQDDVDALKNSVSDILKVVRYYGIDLRRKYFTPATIPGCPLAMKATDKYTVSTSKPDFWAMRWRRQYDDLKKRWANNTISYNRPEDLQVPAFMKSFPSTSVIYEPFFSYDSNLKKYTDDIYTFIEITPNGEATWYVTLTGKHIWKKKQRVAIY